MNDTEASKEIKEKKVNNKIKINPEVDQFAAAGCEYLAGEILGAMIDDVVRAGLQARGLAAVERDHVDPGLVFVPEQRPGGAGVDEDLGCPPVDPDLRRGRGHTGRRSQQIDGGERAVEQLVELSSHPRVLLLCDKPQPRVAGTVLKCRFYGYIGSGEEIGALAYAVRCVFRGELWVPRLALAEALYGPSRPRTASKEHPAL